MSLPRTVELLLKGGEYYLIQQIDPLIRNSEKWSKTMIMNGMGLAPDNDLLGKVETETYTIETKIETPQSGRLELEVLKNETNKTRIILDFDNSELIVDRSQSGVIVDESWQNQDRIDIKFNPQSIDFQVWVDKSTIEIFVDGKSISYLAFPNARASNWLIAAKDSPIKLQTFVVKELKK
jgi:sucrose-6-phosphate hydrolase SacC (GH32 family)